MEKVRIKIQDKFRNILVVDAQKCPNYKCFHPHDCPIQGFGGVRNSESRWMCLTNVNNGCPEKKNLK